MMQLSGSSYRLARAISRRASSIIAERLIAPVKLSVAA
jgi:hypothetical protein